MKKKSVQVLVCIYVLLYTSTYLKVNTTTFNPDMFREFNSYHQCDVMVIYKAAWQQIDLNCNHDNFKFKCFTCWFNNGFSQRMYIYLSP